MWLLESTELNDHIKENSYKRDMVEHMTYVFKHKQLNHYIIEWVIHPKYERFTSISLLLQPQITSILLIF